MRSQYDDTTASTSIMRNSLEGLHTCAPNLMQTDRQSTLTPWAFRVHSCQGVRISVGLRTCYRNNSCASACIHTCPKAHGRVITRRRSISATHRIPGSGINSARWGVHQIRTDIAGTVSWVPTAARFQPWSTYNGILCPRSTSAVTLYKACRPEGVEIYTRGCVQDVDLCINFQPSNWEFALQIDNFHKYQTYTVVQFIAYRDLKEHIACPI